MSEVSTDKVIGRLVVDSRGKRIGKVRQPVFHPTEKRVIGFTVKRPDAALMFHRKDLFVALRGLSENDEGAFAVSDAPDATDRGACKALGVSWDACVLWLGMPVVSESGSMLGYVDKIIFDGETGELIRFSTENGAAKKALLGTYVIPAALVKGFRLGPGVVTGGEDDGVRMRDGADVGGILVSDAVFERDMEGGAAAAAGRATAVVSGAAKKRVVKVKAAADRKVAEVRPAAQKAAASAGEAVNKGAFAAGKQLGRASGMFSAFKEEFQKAARESQEPGEPDADGKSGVSRDARKASAIRETREKS